MKKIFLITSMFTVVTIFSCKDKKGERQEMSQEKKIEKKRLFLYQKVEK